MLSRDKHIFLSKMDIPKHKHMEFRGFRDAKLESILDIKNSNKSILMKKITIFLIAISFFGMLQAQETNTFTFNHIALSVKDVGQSAQFYKDIIGLQEITNRTKMEGIRWFSFGEGKELHLVSILKEPVTINKAVHFALTTSHFDNFIKTLEAKNVTYSDWPGTPNKISLRADGINQIYFQDPDGYWIEVNSIGSKTLKQH